VVRDFTPLIGHETKRSARGFGRLPDVLLACVVAAHMRWGCSIRS